MVETQGMFEQLVGRTIAPGPPVDEDPLAAFEQAAGQIASRLGFGDTTMTRLPVEPPLAPRAARGF